MLSSLVSMLPCSMVRCGDTCHFGIFVNRGLTSHGSERWRERKVPSSRQFLERNLELAPFLKKERLSGALAPQLLDQLHSDEETKHAHVLQTFPHCSNSRGKPIKHPHIPPCVVKKIIFQLTTTGAELWNWSEKFLLKNWS